MVLARFLRRHIPTDDSVAARCLDEESCSTESVAEPTDVSTTAPSSSCFGPCPRFARWILTPDMLDLRGREITGVATADYR